MSSYIGNSSTSGGGEVSDSDSEDQEDSSFYDTQETEVESMLEKFRNTWHKELQISPSSQTQSIKENNRADLENGGDYEKQAKLLFLKGVELEKCGNLYEAIQFYRRAVQLVPDIELRIHNIAKSKNSPRESVDSEHNDVNEYDTSKNDTEESDNEEILEGELLPRIQKKLSKVPYICIPQFEQRATHISSLPVELILYILRWLVSSDLDLHSLELFGNVCRGFYLCGRDSEIWRLACLRVWGHHCGSTPNHYSSWRQMFIERPRLQFNGCYISKTTYIRHGENSFQDQFYRPWHFVAYYRYLRFFPEGLVLMLTSADEPSQSVGLMRYRNVKNPVLYGYYRLKDDKVSLIVQRNEPKTVSTFKKNKKSDSLHESAEQTFHMELQIKNHHRKRHVQLIWTHYSVFTRSKKGDESTCTFDLVPNLFPPLYFSRVKSYTLETDSLLK